MTHVWAVAAARTVSLCIFKLYAYGRTCTGSNPGRDKTLATIGPLAEGTGVA